MTESKRCGWHWACGTLTYECPRSCKPGEPYGPIHLRAIEKQERAKARV